MKGSLIGKEFGKRVEAGEAELHRHIRNQCEDSLCVRLTSCEKEKKKQQLVVVANGLRL